MSFLTLMTGRALGGGEGGWLSGQSETNGGRNTPALSPVHKHFIGKRSDGEVRVGVLVQVHVACQRVAEHFDTGLCGQNLEGDEDA